MSAPLFEKVAFIGLGLIGSSLARVMMAEGLTQNIVASTPVSYTHLRAHET